MNTQQYEQRVRSYKEQKYKLLVKKEELVSKDYLSLEKRELLSTIDETIMLTDYAINSTMRIIKCLSEIESEQKNYKIIESKLEQIMIENNYAEATTHLARRKLNNIGEHLQQLEQLLKYK